MSSRIQAQCKDNQWVSVPTIIRDHPNSDLQKELDLERSSRNTEVSKLKDEIMELRNQLEKLRTDDQLIINTLKDEIFRLNQSLKDCDKSDQIAILKENIEQILNVNRQEKLALEGKVKDLETLCSSLNRELSSISSLKDQTIQELSREIEKLRLEKSLLMSLSDPLENLAQNFSRLNLSSSCLPNPDDLNSDPTPPTTKMEIEDDKISSQSHDRCRTNFSSVRTSRPGWKSPKEKLIRIFVRKDSANRSSSLGQTAQCSVDPIAIPWRGKIIRANIALIKEFKGNFDDMLASLGGDAPMGFEKRFTKVRIPWNDEIIWATPFQILRSEGDIERLQSFLSSTTGLSGGTHRSNPKRVQAKDSTF